MVVLSHKDLWFVSSCCEDKLKEKKAKPLIHFFTDYLLSACYILITVPDSRSINNRSKIMSKSYLHFNLSYLLKCGIIGL